MDRGEFPERWKRQRWVLLPKHGKPPGDPCVGIPTYLPSGQPGKQLERIILSRLMVYTEKPDDYGLSENQFGSRKGRSIVALQKKRRGVTAW